MDESAKADRLARLNALIESQRQTFNAAQVGRTLNVLIERKGRHSGQVGGRSPYLQAVHLDGSDNLIGQIVPVRIITLGPNALSGIMDAVEAA